MKGSHFLLSSYSFCKFFLEDLWFKRKDMLILVGTFRLFKVMLLLNVKLLNYCDNWKYLLQPSSVGTEISVSGPVIQEVTDSLPAETNDITLETHNYSRSAQKPIRTGTSISMGGRKTNLPHTRSHTVTIPGPSQTHSTTQNKALDKISPSKVSIFVRQRWKLFFGWGEIWKVS